MQLVTQCSSGAPTPIRSSGVPPPTPSSGASAESIVWGASIVWEPLVQSFGSIYSDRLGPNNSIVWERTFRLMLKVNLNNYLEGDMKTIIVWD